MSKRRRNYASERSQQQKLQGGKREKFKSGGVRRKGTSMSVRFAKKGKREMSKSGRPRKKGKQGISSSRRLRKKELHANGSKLRPNSI